MSDFALILNKQELFLIVMAMNKCRNDENFKYKDEIGILFLNHSDKIVPACAVDESYLMKDL